MKKWIFIAIVCLMVSANFIHANSDTIQSEKSEHLIKELKQLAPNDTARFKIYSKLINMAPTLEIETYYSNKMLEDAVNLDIDKFKCEAYYQQIVLAYNQYDAESVKKWMIKLEPIARRIKNYNYLFLGKRAVIDMLMVNGEYVKEEKEAQKMLQEAQKLNYPTGITLAYICLANVYNETNRLNEAADMFIKAHAIALADEDRSLVYQINNSIINIYQSNKDKKYLLKWIKIADNYLQKQIRTDKDIEENLKGWLMLTKVAYVRYYTNMNDLQHAAYYMKQAEKYSMDEYPTYGRIYHLARFRYFQKAGLFEEALVETDALAKIFKEISPDNYAYMIFFKALTLAELKREDEALATYKRGFEISDSIKIVFLNRQTKQLRKDYDADSLILEKEKANKKIQILFLGVMILVIIFLVIFAIHTLRVRRNLKKSEEEMRQMAKEMEIANIAKENFLSTISTSISLPLNEVVKGSLLLATDEITDKQERQTISCKLNKMSAELMELINNILNLSKLEAGMMKFRMSNVEILPFVKAVVNANVSKGSKIQAIYDETASSLMVYADEGYLHEAFKHLLANSSNEMTLTMQVAENKQEIHFHITGSELSSYQEQSQEIAIANEVSRLVVESFSGKYKTSAEDHSIDFTLPVAM